MTTDKKCLINWVGGKRLLRKTIAPLIPKDIKSYIKIGDRVVLLLVKHG